MLLKSENGKHFMEPFFFFRSQFPHLSIRAIEFQKTLPDRPKHKGLSTEAPIDILKTFKTFKPATPPVN